MIIIDGMPASEPNENKTPKPWEGQCMNQIDTMLIPYARQTALKLVYNLANNDADKSAYEEAKNVLERAVAALDDGRDPADSIERIDGQLVEL